MRRLVTSLIIVMAVVMGPALPVAAHGAKGPYCGIRWGSLAKSADVYTHATGTITGLRAGQHGCFDRLVIDLGPSAFGTTEVDYGYQASDGSGVDSETGEPLPIAGGAALSIVVNASAHDENYRPTFVPADRFAAVDVSGFRTLRQVAFLGTFEAQTEIVLGVRARLPYQVFLLEGPRTGRTGGH